jgi:hypothetical protein
LGKVGWSWGAIIAFCCGGVLSVVWIIFALIFLFHQPAPCSNGLDCFRNVNDWGDFWAGTFSPLAFIWLVVAVFLQSMELREQRQELALTRLEFKENRAVAQAQAEESHRQAEYIGKQTDLLQLQEQRYREREVDANFDAAIEALAATLSNYDHIWEFSTTHRDVSIYFRLDDYKKDSDRRIVTAAGQELRAALRKLREREPDPNHPLILQCRYPYDFARTFRMVLITLDAYELLQGRSRSLAQALELKALRRNMEFIINRSPKLPPALADLGLSAGVEE